MKDELEQKEYEFTITSVEGYWKKEGITPSNTLYCSDITICESGSVI